MRKPRFWGLLYLSMAFWFIYFAIEQHSRSGGEWHMLTIGLMAIAAYDIMVAFRYFTFKQKQ